MLATSPEFLAALRQSHLVVVTAELYPTDGSGPLSVPIEANAGEVQLDRTARSRRAGSLQLPFSTDLQALGLEPDLRLLPFGGYVRLHRGLRYPVQVETVTLGHLRIESLSSSATGDIARLELADRMAQVADEPLLSPYAPTGLRPSQAAFALVQEVFGATIGYSSTVPPASEPALVDVVYTDDRAAAVADLAKSVGAEAYFDELGNFRFDPLPDPSSAAPVFTIDAGPSGILIDADEALDRTSLVNGVLVQGQSDASTPPVAALVVDSTPGSPTLWGGPFGKVARVETSTAVQSVAQATAAATALLQNQLGLERLLSLQMVPNPALVPGDVVTLVLDDGSSEVHVVESLRMPLDAGSAAELVTRSVWRPGSMPGGHESAGRARRERRAYVGAQAWLELREAQRGKVQV